MEEIYYYPYGSTRVDAGVLSVNHKYTSQELDSETGLYYYGARYYNPVLGRFISPDAIVPDPGDPQAFNRYSYVLNNPLRYTDPTGHGFWDKVLGAVETAIGGVLVFVGEGGPVSWVGSAVMADGVNRMSEGDANINTPGGGIAVDDTGNINIYSGWSYDEGNIYFSSRRRTVQPITHLELDYNRSGGNINLDMYAANSDLYTNDGRPYTPGERAYEESLTYQGSTHMHCNELVMKSYKGAGYEVGYINTRNLSSSSYFQKVTNPGTGDIVLWPNKHMGFYVDASEGIRIKNLQADLFHAPGANSSNPVNHSRMEWINNFYGEPVFYRYKE